MNSLKFPGDDKFLSEIKLKIENADNVDYLAEASNMALDMMMAKVQRQNKWADVCIVLDKVKITLNKYQKNFQKIPAIYRLFWLTPSRLVRQIKNRFDSESVTKPFFKTLAYEEEEIRNYDWYCAFSLTFLVITIIATVASIIILVKSQLYWIILLPPILVGLCIVIFMLQDKFYKYVIQEIVLVNLFEKFVKAFNERENKRIEFIEKTYSIPETIERRWQESEMQKVFNHLDAKEQEQLKTLQLEAAIRLQQFSALLSLNQARNEDEINEIRSKTRLRDLEQELNILDKIESEKDRRKLAFHSIDASQQVLVAMSSFLADKKMKDDNVERLLTLFGGLKKDLRNSNDDFGGVPWQEFTDQFLNNETFPGAINID